MADNGAWQTPHRRRRWDLTPQRRGVFQNATIQEKRSGRLRLAALVDAHLYEGRFGDDDRIYARLLDLTGQKNDVTAQSWCSSSAS
jgi:hypothetical protein